MSLAMFLKQIRFTVLHLGPAIFVSMFKSKSFLIIVSVEGIDGPLHPVLYNVNLVFIPVSEFVEYPFAICVKTFLLLVSYVECRWRLGLIAGQCALLPELFLLIKLCFLLCSCFMLS